MADDRHPDDPRPERAPAGGTSILTRRPTHRLHASPGAPRVVLLTSYLSPAAGGLAASVSGLAASLCSADVHLAGLRDSRRPGAAGEWGPRVHAHRVLFGRPFGFAPGLPRTLEELAPGLIDVQGLWMYPSLANLRHHRSTGTPYIVTPHGMLDPWARNHSAWKKRIARRWFEDEHLRRASCLRATADMEAGHFRSFGLRNPIAVVPNGVDVPPFVPRGLRAAKRRLLFLSRIHPKKGLPFLLRAWAALEPHRPEWELVIAGPDEGGHTEEMQRLAGRLGLRAVTWQGAVEGSTKDVLYRSADLFVLPTHAENFGLVVAEALARSVPVITTRNAPWSGLVTQRCGWWVDLADGPFRAALAEATACQPAQLDEMGARGRQWMERDFSWARVGEKMMELYRWVLAGGAAPHFVDV